MESPSAIRFEMIFHIRTKKGIEFDPFFIPFLFFVLYSLCFFIEINSCVELRKYCEAHFRTTLPLK